MLRNLLALAGALIAVPALAQIIPFGVCAHLGGGSEFNDHEREMQLMQDAGIRWARADFTWGYFERQDDQWKFDNYDTIVAASKNCDVTLLPILCYNVDWAFPAHDHLDQWCDYVRTVVGRYKDDLKHWEVWNEPNIGFWKPKPNPEEYTRLLVATYEAIKDTDPEAQVVYGGTAGIPLDFLRKTFEMGAFDAFDVLAVHPYRYPRLPEDSDLAGDLQKTWALMDEFGGGKEMWITEFGWPTHINAVVGDGAFPAQLVHHAATLRFPDREEFKAAVLHEKGFRGCGDVGLMTNAALERLPDVSSRLIGLADLAALDPADTQILVMPTGEHYPADYYDAMLKFVREGGLLAHLGGVPFYYANRLKDGEWEAPFAGEAGREPLHVGWKAWWTREGTPEKARATKLMVGEDSGITLPAGIKSTRWLTDEKLQGNDKFVPIMSAHNGDEMVGYPVALYLYDSDLKGGFLGTILDVSMRGVTEDTQGVILPRALLISLGEGLENIFWYEFRDGGNDATYNEHRFGTIHVDMTPKLAYVSYRALTRALGEAKFVEKLDAGEGNYCYVFDAGETQTVALWRAAGTDTVRLAVMGDAIEVRDYQGKALAASPVEGELELEASSTVTYITGLDTVEAL